MSRTEAKKPPQPPVLVTKLRDAVPEGSGTDEAAPEADRRK